MSKAVQQSTKPALTSTDEKETGAIRTDSGRELMQAVLAKPRTKDSDELSKDKRFTGVVIGTLSDVSEDGQPMVYYPGIPTGKPLPAISTGCMSHHKSGQELALGFVNGDPALPIILGVIQKPGKQEQPTEQLTPDNKMVDVKVDGDRLTLSAEHEIVLQCGKSSITLTRAGKVILKGAYLSTHSTGVNRIKGGSVQIN